MPVSVIFQDLSDRLSGLQNDKKSGMLAKVLMELLGPDSLNTQDGGWTGRGTLGCAPAGLHSSSGHLQGALVQNKSQTPPSQSCLKPALCTKVCFSNLVCYSLKCQPPPALSRLSCKVFPLPLLGSGDGEVLGPFQAFLKHLFPLFRQGLAPSQTLLPSSHPSLAGRRITCLKGATFLGGWNQARKLNTHHKH